MLLSHCTKNSWSLDHLDVTTAFLNPKADRDDIYMQLLEGIDWLDTRLSNSQRVRLLKALYGLKQAPRLWFEDIQAFLLKLGFRQCNEDPNIYIKDRTIILLYVDDLLITFPSHDKQSADEVKRLFGANCGPRPTGDGPPFLAMHKGHIFGSIKLANVLRIKLLLCL